MFQITHLRADRFLSFIMGWTKKLELSHTQQMPFPFGACLYSGRGAHYFVIPLCNPYREETFHKLMQLG